MTLLEVGGDVVLSGAGIMNLTSLTNVQPFFRGSSIAPSVSQFTCGLAGPGPFNSRLYTGATFNSPTNFGTGNQTVGSSGTGDFFGVTFAVSNNQLFVQSGYTSGSFISGTTTFNSTTLSTLGATPGTYTWSWGSGPTLSSIIMVVGTPSVTPTPTQTNTPTITQTPSPSPVTCDCYRFQNETGTSDDITYTNCSGVETTITMAPSEIQYKCVRSGTSITTASITFVPCTSPTTCTDDTECSGCSF
jgi:hypothetical protein